MSTSARKGILLAGGTGSRLHPMTLGVSKHLLPIYDKPMIYYPLSALMFADIREILIITTPQDTTAFKRLLSDGSQWGLSFSYAQQAHPSGLAEAFLIGKEFIGDSNVALVLGDNIFYGQGFRSVLEKASAQTTGATIFAHRVNDPERYGVVNFDSQGKAIALTEKPVSPTSNYAIPGLYFYDNRVVEIAESLQPSVRGELEITDINLKYMHAGELSVQLFGRGFTWFDTGTQDSLLDACNFVAAVETRQGVKIACPEEIALIQNFIDKHQVQALAKNYNNDYGKYLNALIGEG